jgi:hypothetical protein
MNPFESFLVLSAACTSVGMFAAGFLLLLIFRMTEKRRR